MFFPHMRSTTVCLAERSLTERRFVFLNKEEIRRLCLNRFKLLKSPQPKLLDESILFSLVQQVYLSASIR